MSQALNPLWMLLTDPVSWAVVGTASLTLAYSCWRAYLCDLETKPSSITRQGKSNTPIPVQTIDGWQALMFPIMASVSLLALFYFQYSLYTILLVMISFYSVYSFVFAFKPLLSMFNRTVAPSLPIFTYTTPSSPVASGGSSILDGGDTANNSNGSGGSGTNDDGNILQSIWRYYCAMPVSELALILISCFTVIVWLSTGHWFLNNVLGIVLCITYVSFLRLPSMKVSTLLLTGLFLYDIFWVFYSQPVFGSNVMVTVAQSIDLPVKLMFPRTMPNGTVRYSMLGLGDIALPAMLVSFALRFDLYKYKGLCRNGYFTISFVGYVVGLVATLFVLAMFKAAQPALLYIVPSTLLPIVIAGLYRNDMYDLWNGIPTTLIGGNRHNNDAIVIDDGSVSINMYTRNPSSGTLQDLSMVSPSSQSSGSNNNNNNGNELLEGYIPGVSNNNNNNAAGSSSMFVDARRETRKKD